MRSPEGIIECHLQGALTLRDTSYHLLLMIDRENVDRAMRLLPPRLFEDMRIFAGFANRDDIVYVRNDPAPEPFRFAALLEWLAKEGISPIFEPRE